MKPYYVVLALLCAIQPLFGVPKISFKDPVPPANNTRVLAQRCPGELCLENCVFDLGKMVSTVKIETGVFDAKLFGCSIKLLHSDGSSLASTNFSLSGNEQEVLPAWTGTKEVACDSVETLTLQVVAVESEDEIVGAETNLIFYVSTNTLSFALYCVGCAKATATEGNGKTKTEQSTSDREVRLGCFVANLDTNTHPVEFRVVSERGWSITAPSSPLLLTNGEARELFLDVTVPGDAPEGSIDRITVTSSLAGLEETISSTTMELEIQTPLRLWIAEFEPDGIVLLRVSGPWNTESLVEWSENLDEWNLLATVNAPAGTEHTEVSDPGPRKGNSRFYRARIQTLPPPASAAQKAP